MTRSCDVCRSPLTVGQFGVHFLCDPSSLVGRTCTCPPDCSANAYGNGPRMCDPDCAPCRANRGQPLRKRRQRT